MIIVVGFTFIIRFFSSTLSTENTSNHFAVCSTTIVKYDAGLMGFQSCRNQKRAKEFMQIELTSHVYATTFDHTCLMHVGQVFEVSKEINYC